MKIEGMISMRALTYLSIIILAFLIASCAKVKTPVNNPAHPQDWLNRSSEEFHANKVVLIGDVTCKSCHGENLEQPNSFCSSCHSKQAQPISYPHPPDWTDFKSDHNHGKFIENHPNSLTCNRCHGGVNDLAPACSNCHVGER